MRTVTNAAEKAAAPKRALYEYRGTNRDLTGPAGAEAPRPNPVTLFSANTAPSCSSCAATTEKVVGGWWCSSCEMAAG